MLFRSTDMTCTYDVTGLLCTEHLKHESRPCNGDYNCTCTSVASARGNDVSSAVPFITLQARTLQLQIFLDSSTLLISGGREEGRSTKREPLWRRLVFKTRTL